MVDRVQVEPAINHAQAVVPPAPPAQQAESAAAQPQGDQSTSINQMFAHHVMDARRLFVMFEHSQLLIVLIVSMYVSRHIFGICTWILFTVSLLRSEGRIVEALKNRDPPNHYVISGSLITCAANCAIIYMAWPSSHLIDYLFLHSPSEPLTFAESLWVVLMNDLGVRFAASAACAAWILISPEKRRRVMCNTFLSFSVLHRSLIPINIWCTYLSVFEYGRIQPSGTVTVYAVFKLISAYPLFKKFLRNLSSVLGAVTDDSYGERVSLETCMEEGHDQCVICFSPFTNPMKLRCGHVFCEGCIDTWLSTHTTCPCCRETIPGTGPSFSRSVHDQQIAQLF